MNSKIETKINSAITTLCTLAKENTNQTKKIVNLLHELLAISPGDTLNKRKRFISERLESKARSYAYLRRLLIQVVIEKNLDLPPATLNEFQARTLSELKNKDSLQLAYIRAKEIANSERKPIHSAHIRQAIDELNKPILKESIQTEDENPPKKTQANQLHNNESIFDETFVVDDDRFIDSTNSSLLDYKKGELVKTLELFEKIKPHLESNTDKETTATILNGSQKIWRICRVISKYSRFEIDIQQLNLMIDSEKRPLKSKRKNRTRTPPINRKAKPINFKK